MRFLCLLVGEPDIEGPVPGTPEFTQMLSDYESATRAMAADGVLVDSGPLQPPAAAATLRVRDGRPLVTDGPFAELKEQIGGYSLREDDQCQRWHLLHACRADLLRRLGRATEAGDAYRAALALDPPPAEREFLARRLAEIDY